MSAGTSPSTPPTASAKRTDADGHELAYAHGTAHRLPDPGHIKGSGTELPAVTRDTKIASCSPR
ncbi:hypothetical protein [Streptomyces sp. MMS24-I29]|uniref:hypothetical protein n=1 Tax=Streptomyces sp. MMS24-I29 TaxID=3351480 RepID=UPI003C7B724D